MNLLNTVAFCFLFFSILKVLQIIKNLENRVEDLEEKINEGGVD